MRPIKQLVRHGSLRHFVGLRIIWAITARGETYRTGHRPALAA